LITLSGFHYIIQKIKQIILIISLSLFLSFCLSLLFLFPSFSLSLFLSFSLSLFLSFSLSLFLSFSLSLCLSFSLSCLSLSLFLSFSLSPHSFFPSLPLPHSVNVISFSLCKLITLSGFHYIILVFEKHLRKIKFAKKTNYCI
jgi:hypothetical protein